MRVGFFPTNGCDPFSGYGKAELGIMQGLIQSGVTIDNSAPVAIILGFAHWLKHEGYKRKRRWLYTMSESTRVSDQWVQTINKYAERVLVPAPPLVDVYKESGVTVPVDWVGLPVDCPTPSFQDKRDMPRKPFTFLGYSLPDARKGDELTIAAFAKMFQRDPAYQLVIKVRDKRSWLDGCREPNIRIVKGKLDEARWYELLRAAHCFVFPSRAEGWGMPPREAVLAGVPTLATRWLGMWDVDCWGYGIPVQYMAPCSYNEYQANDRKGLWAVPNIDALQMQMQQVVSHYDNALAHARKGGVYLQANWSSREVGKRIKQLLLEHA